MSDHSHLRVTFYTEPVEDTRASREAGRPIFKDEEFVFILIGGDPKSTIRAPAHSSPDRDPMTGQARTYAEKYPDEYRFFKANEDQHQMSGTPLTEVPWLTASRREELKALKIFTVEALAGLDGTLLGRIGMGGRELKNKAEAWLEAAAGNAPAARMAEELAARDAVIAQLQADMAALKNGVVAAPPAAPEPDDSESPFAEWGDEDIKNWIKEATGTRPLGNPSHKTLVAQADKINDDLRAAQAKAA